MGRHLMKLSPDTSLMTPHLLSSFLLLTILLSQQYVLTSQIRSCFRLTWCGFSTTEESTQLTLLNLVLSGMECFTWIPASHSGGRMEAQHSKMLSDAVTCILRASGCCIFPYIDNVRVASSDDTQHQFQLLYDLLSSLGLPINKDKLNSSSDDVTCPGITKYRSQTKKQQFIKNVSMSAIKNLKNSFQSLIGKFTCVHKCVHPARIFINRMLDLFRNDSHNKFIHLTSQLFQDLDWFQKFLSHFSGVTLFKKPIITHLFPVYWDACLSDMRGIWGTRSYSAPVPVFPNFYLKVVHLEMVNLVVAFKLWAKY